MIYIDIGNVQVHAEVSSLMRRRFERDVYSVVGQYIGLKDTPPVRIALNDELKRLETTYKNILQPEYTDMGEECLILLKKLGMFG